MNLAEIEARAAAKFAKAFPPPQYWRAVFGRRNGKDLPLRAAKPDREYNRLPPVKVGPRLVMGPVYPKAEIAEQKALEHLEKCGPQAKKLVKVVKVIAVAEDGTPIALF